MSDERSYDYRPTKVGVIRHSHQHELSYQSQYGLLPEAIYRELTQYDMATSKAYIPALINLACIGSFVLFISTNSDIVSPRDREDPHSNL